MANTVTGSTYAGEFAGDYVAAALLSAPTLEKGLITVLPNIHCLLYTSPSPRDRG